MKVVKLMIAASALFSATAMAGYLQPAEVVVDHDNTFASGDMRSARDAKDDITFIGCGVRHFDDGTGGAFVFGFCQATDADENSVNCTTTNPALLDALDVVADNSFLTFSWEDDGDGNLTCTRIGASTQSFYLPKK